MPNIFNSEKPKVNPIMYKEYLVRYPAYSIQLVIQMIDSVSSPDVKLHKKVNIFIASLLAIYLLIHFLLNRQRL